MGWAARSLARSALYSAEGSLPRPNPLTTTTFLTHLSLCMAAASPPADACPAVTGRNVHQAADAGIDLPPFPHKLKRGRREHRHPPQPNNVCYGEGMGKVKLTVLLVVGEQSFAQPLLIVTQRQKRDALMLLSAAFFHSSHRQKPFDTPPPPKKKHSSTHFCIFLFQ